MENRPKRRKHKDNPYELNIIDSKYIVKFKDNKKETHYVEVNAQIYEIFDKFELRDLSELNEYDNHIEHLELYDETLERRIIHKQELIEDVIIRKVTFEKLHYAIQQLSEIEKRRIKMYYFEDKTLEEIAKIENTSHQAISKSLQNSIKKLKNLLKFKI